MSNLYEILHDLQLAKADVDSVNSALIGIEERQMLSYSLGISIHLLEEQIHRVESEGIDVE